MKSIDQSIIEHQLAINPEVKPVRQKIHQLNSKRREETEVEVKKLLRAKFIKEVRYPKYLENKVMVIKKTQEDDTCA